MTADGPGTYEGNLSGKMLITGASGFVGRILGDALAKKNVTLSLVSRSPIAIQTIAVGAIDGATNWAAALQQCQVVVHLAARVHVMHDTMADPLAAFRSVNVDGTLNLARQAAITGTKRFVFISSVKVNGEGTEPNHAFTENHTPNPQDAYGQSKHEAEQGLRQIAAETGMEVVIVRPPLVWPRRQSQLF